MENNQGYEKSTVHAKSHRFLKNLRQRLIPNKLLP